MNTPFRSIDHGFQSIDFSMDGKLILLTSSTRNTLYDVENGLVLRDIPYGKFGCLSPNTRHIAVRSNLHPSSAEIVDVFSHNPVQIFGDKVYQIKPFSDRDTFLVASENYASSLLDIYSWGSLKKISALDSFHANPPIVEISSDDKIVFVGVDPFRNGGWGWMDDYDGKIKAYHLETGEQTSIPSTEKSEGILIFKPIPQTNWLFTIWQNGIARIYDYTTGELVEVFPLPIRSIHDLDFSLDSRWALFGARNSRAYLMDWRSRSVVREIAYPDAVGALYVKFFPYSPLVLTSQNDKKTHVWDIKDIYESSETPFEAPTARPLPPTPTVTFTPTPTNTYVERPVYPI